MMQLSAVIRREGGQYVAWCPEVDVASQGPSVEVAVANLREAVELYLEDEDAIRPEGSPLITTLEVRDGQVAGSVGA